MSPPSNVIVCAPQPPTCLCELKFEEFIPSAQDELLLDASEKRRRMTTALSGDDGAVIFPALSEYSDVVHAFRQASEELTVMKGPKLQWNSGVQGTQVIEQFRSFREAMSFEHCMVLTLLASKHLTNASVLLAREWPRPEDNNNFESNRPVYQRKNTGDSVVSDDLPEPEPSWPSAEALTEACKQCCSAAGLYHHARQNLCDSVLRTFNAQNAPTPHEVTPFFLQAWEAGAMTSAQLLGFVLARSKGTAAPLLSKIALQVASYAQDCLKHLTQTGGQNFADIHFRGVSDLFGFLAYGYAAKGEWQKESWGPAEGYVLRAKRCLFQL